MEIEAVVGSAETQTLPFQENYIGQIYLQDCGHYEVKYEPTYPFFTFSMTG